MSVIIVIYRYDIKKGKSAEKAPKNKAQKGKNTAISLFL